MNSKKRRENIEISLLEANIPQKGVDLAKKFGVTRQVIVKDIAILRAEGKDIIATPEGYIMGRESRGYIKRLLATSHTKNDIEDELKSVIKYGGIVEDVIVEHPLYGDIRATLMIKTLEDIQNFIKNFNESKAEPLSSLTSGIHMHTISAESEEVMNKIVNELKNKGYLILD